MPELNIVAPFAGTVIAVWHDDQDSVMAGQALVVLEAMKMEQPLNAHRSGTVVGLKAEVGASVSSGAVICEIKD